MSFDGISEPTSAGEHTGDSFAAVLTPEGELLTDSPFYTPVDPEDLRSLYRDLVLVRRFDTEATALQRQGEGFTHLPMSADFDPAATTIAPSYSASWLACSLLADRYGRAKLVRLYRTAATDASSDPDTALVEAFQGVLGTTQGDFTKSWLRYLKQLSS